MKKQVSFFLWLQEGQTVTYLLDRKGITLDQESMSTLSVEGRQKEYDPLEIVYSVRSCFHKLIRSNKLSQDQIDHISIVSEPYAILAWDRLKGAALSQVVAVGEETIDRRFLLPYDSIKELVQERTGLSFSHAGFLVLLKTLYKKYQEKHAVLSLGSVESWVLFHLTGCQTFCTDYTHAQHSLLLNYATLEWDSFLLQEFGIPFHVLPELRRSFPQEKQGFGVTQSFVPLPDGIPISVLVSESQCRLLSSRAMTYKESHICLQNERASIVVQLGLEQVRDVSHVKKILLPYKTSYRKALAWDIQFPILPKYMKRPHCELESGFDFLGEVKSNDPVLLPSLDVRQAYKSPQFILHRLDYDTSQHAIEMAFEKSVVFQIKYFIALLEQEFSIGVSELSLSGERSRQSKMMQFLSDILQIPILHRYDKDTVLQGGLFLMAQFGSFFSKSTIRVKGKLFKHYVPMMDPISSFASYNQWLSLHNRLSKVSRCMI